MVPLAVVLLRVVYVTRWVLAFLVMLTVSLLSVMPGVLVPLVMLCLMARVLQGVSRLPVPLVMTTVRVLQVIDLGVSSPVDGRRRCLAWALATPGGGLGGRLWSGGSPVLAVLVASGVWACPRQLWRRVLMVTVLLMSVTSAVAGVAPGYAEGEVGVGHNGEGGWQHRR